MNNIYPKIFAFVSCLAVFADGAFAQTTTSPAVPGGSTVVRPSMPAVPPNFTLPPSVSMTDVQSLIRQFDAQRDQLLAQRQSDLARLQNATAAERERILAEMRALQGQRLDEQKELARKIRQDLKDLREKRRAGGG